MRNRGATAFRTLGFTLVELLVAMVIGLFIVGGVVSVMVDSKDNFVFEQEVAFIQENARFVSDELSYEVRMAGFKGCNEAVLENYSDGSISTVPAPSPAPTIAPNAWTRSGRGLWGFDGDDLTSAAAAVTAFGGDLVEGNDVLIVNRGEQNDLSLVENHTPATGTILLTGSSGLEAGGLAIIGDIDCSNSAIFEISTVAGDTISYSTASGPLQQYSDGSFLMGYQSHAYYVKESAITGLPTLYKETLLDRSTANTQAQELISGVEVFDVLYGLDISLNYDGEIDVYVPANEITNDVADASSNWVGWDRVISARVVMVLRGQRDILPTEVAADLGDDINLDVARYLRQKVVVTARARNRGL